jgi:hypothetical protein
MSTGWAEIILDTPDYSSAWVHIYETLLAEALENTSPAALHYSTVAPDRLLAESAWELWEAYPTAASRASQKLIEWCSGTVPTGRAVLIIDALSLRELPIILGAAAARNIPLANVIVTGSECPSTTDQFAKAIGASSRAALANDTKPQSFKLLNAPLYTDVLSLPFEDCPVPPVANLVIWHTWLDDLIHLQNKLPDQIAANTGTVLQGDGFWSFVNKLRQGRSLVITSDHGYAVSKLFSSQVTDQKTIEDIRETFGASRYVKAVDPFSKRFMPPLMMTENQQHVIMGQLKWKVQGPAQYISHGGMSLLEVAVPWIELEAIR